MTNVYTRSIQSQMSASKGNEVVQLNINQGIQIIHLVSPCITMYHLFSESLCQFTVTSGRYQRPGDRIWTSPK